MLAVAGVRHDRRQAGHPVRVLDRHRSGRSSRPSRRRRRGPGDRRGGRAAPRRRRPCRSDQVGGLGEPAGEQRRRARRRRVGRLGDLRRQADVAVVEADHPEPRPRRGGRRTPSARPTSCPPSPITSSSGSPSSPWTSYSIVIPFAAQSAADTSFAAGEPGVGGTDRPNVDGAGYVDCAMGWFRRRHETPRSSKRVKSEIAQPARGDRAPRRAARRSTLARARRCPPGPSIAEPPEPSTTRRPVCSRRGRRRPPRRAGRAGRRSTLGSPGVDRAGQPDRRARQRHRRPRSGPTGTSADEGRLLDELRDAQVRLGQRAGPLPDRLPRGPRPPGRAAPPPATAFRPRRRREADLGSAAGSLVGSAEARVQPSGAVVRTGSALEQPPGPGRRGRLPRPRPGTRRGRRRAQRAWPRRAVGRPGQQLGGLGDGRRPLRARPSSGPRSAPVRRRPGGLGAGRGRRGRPRSRGTAWPAPRRATSPMPRPLVVRDDHEPVLGHGRSRPVPSCSRALERPDLQQPVGDRDELEVAEAHAWLPPAVCSVICWAIGGSCRSGWRRCAGRRGGSVDDVGDRRP